MSTPSRSLPPFLRWYMEYVGHYRVPPMYHYWCAMSLLAAFTSDRLTYEHLPGKPLRPNLFVFLIGHSAAYKGVAISYALDLIRPGLVIEGHGTKIGKGQYTISTDFPYLYIGRTSGEAFYSHLAELSHRLVPVGAGPLNVFFVAPELKLALHYPGGTASGFITMMTHQYDNTGGAFYDRTQLHGFKEIPPAVVNWIAGTTMDWMVKAISAEDFASGFGRRILAIFIDEREPFKYRPSMSPRHAQLEAVLRNHLQALRLRTTVLRMTTEAEDCDESWAAQRHADRPGDVRLHPFHDSAETIARKLAILYAAARSPAPEWLTIDDVLLAQQAVQWIEARLPLVLDLVVQTKETRGVAFMRQQIKERKTVPVNELRRYLGAQLGITKKAILEYEATLLLSGEISIDHRLGLYHWRTGAQVQPADLPQ